MRKMRQGELPDLTANGVLPEGVHSCSIDAVGKVFGQFQRSDRRCKLFGKLKEYIEEVQKAGWRASVIVDGSFVMARVDEPNDIDLILVLPEDWDTDTELRPFEYNLVARKQVGRKYGFDVFAVRSGSEEEKRLIEFFQRIKSDWMEAFQIPGTTRKGIARVML